MKNAKCDAFICPDCGAELQESSSGTQAYCEACRQWITDRTTPRPARGRTKPAPGFQVWNTRTASRPWHYGTAGPYQMSCFTGAETRTAAVLATWSIYDAIAASAGLPDCARCRNAGAYDITVEGPEGRGPTKTVKCDCGHPMVQPGGAR